MKSLIITILLLFITVTAQYVGIRFFSYFVKNTLIKKYSSNPFFTIIFGFTFLMNDIMYI